MLRSIYLRALRNAQTGRGLLSDILQRGFLQHGHFLHYILRTDYCDGDDWVNDCAVVGTKDLSALSECPVDV